MELGAHQMSLEPFGVWASPSHMRHPQDMDLASRSTRHQQLTVSAPSSPPLRYTPTREASGLGQGTNSRSNSPSGYRDHSGGGGGGGSGNPSITVTPDTRRSTKPKPRSTQSPPQTPSPSSKQPTPTPSPTTQKPNLERTAMPNAPSLITLPLRPSPKRTRATDDVDGPGTDILPSKKRRLLLYLITSRLSRPFSLPATHILQSQTHTNKPAIQQLALRRAGHQSSLVRKAAILNRIRIRVRQAAVSRDHSLMADWAARGNALNHGLQLVTTPAMGETWFPGGNGGELPMPPTALGKFVPPGWRPHTTCFHPPIEYTSSGGGGGGIQTAANEHQSGRMQAGVGISQCGSSHFHYNATQPSMTSLSGSSAPPLHPNPGTLIPPSRPPYSHAPIHQQSSHPDPQLQTTSHPQPHPNPIPKPNPRTTTSHPQQEEEDTTAFPAASFHDRYADLSDDDMDDVYADFGVLFGSSISPPSSELGLGVGADSGGGGVVEDQFYEEYLDELDGIPWVA